MVSKRYETDLDADDIIRRAEAELLAAPSKSDSVSRTPCIVLCLGMLFFIVFLPRVQIGGYVDKSQVVDAPGGKGGKGGGKAVPNRESWIGKRPPFRGDCTQPRKRLPSNWPLRGSSHIQRYWVNKAVPGPMKYSHMAMVEQLPNGTFVAAWQASAGLEGTDDQHIVLSFSLDLEGRRWGEPFPLPVAREGAQWSPVLHKDDRGRLWLFYAESVSCKSDTTPPRWYPGGDIKVTMWGERGDRWKSPRTIYTQAANGNVPKVIANKPIVLTSREWVLPFWTESHPGGTCTFPDGTASYAGVLVSEDDGWSWDARGKLSHPETWLIENTVAEIRGGFLLMYFRTMKGNIYGSQSDDKGRTWSSATSVGLPNPDSKIAMLRLTDGSLALAYNHHPKLKRPNRRARTNLDVAISVDDGRHWKQIMRIEDQQDAGLRIHYPTLLQSGCTLYVAYSKFYHEEFAYKAEGNTTGTELGVKLVAVDIR